ncbi:glycoside hydrolase family 16 protein [Wolfiporia cocos MD-104 SS10]|uniref:Glycoside hydrolase family 16 protein n=1 Tax=Wolfiporia cocos (strain MD-104) TaxID=742152 RepID=A0A2H3JBA3_WOLCO|nr:glycoside hydrolase family 16 protein [Wolfiporia cocos MD-104 SS10]
MTNATNNNPLSPQAGYGTQYAQYGNGGYGVVGGEEELGRPFAPFMGVGSEGGHGGSQDGRNSPGLSNNPLYRNSAAGAMAVGYGECPFFVAIPPHLPRSQSSAALSMRAPFLSPASRPTSSVWAPPSVPYAYPPGSASSSALHGQYGFGGGSAYGGSQYGHGAYSSYADITAQLRKAKPVMPSSRLPQKMTDEEKPWTQLKDGRERAGWWLTLLGMFAGVAGAAVLCYFSYVSVDVLRDSDLCQVFSEDWSNGLDLNKTWYPDSQLGGFGNGEFQITSTNSKNLYVQNNQLYIMPTLTSDDIGESEIFNGGTYEVSGCTTSNATACKATSSNKTGAVINPVMSSRISTQNSYSIKYGRVEVVAKIPQGDWLWPAIWMLPVNNTYGPWPLSGEIDILEARGNPPSYGAQGTDFVRAALNYGVLDSLQTNIYGWWQDKRTAFSEDFHTYAIEWTDSWMRLYVDSRIDAMVNLKMQGKGGKSFFDRGNYPSVAHNGSNTEVVIENIWATGGPSAPFDQEFYLIIDLAAGGTSGWFPDNVGDKPWYDGSATAMREFAEAQSTWYATWPSDADDRAFRIDSVKMWKLGAC